MNTQGKDGNKADEVEKLVLLKSADQVHAVVNRRAHRGSTLILFQVISNQMDKPSYGGSLICGDVKKIYGSSVQCYSIQNQLCVDIFGHENFKVKNTLKPIYIVVNSSLQILHICSQNSKKQVITALELSFKEIQISESSMITKKQEQPNLTEGHVNTKDSQGILDDTINENKFGSQDTTGGTIPFVERKSPAEQYEQVKNALDYLSQLKPTDFAAY